MVKPTKFEDLKPFSHLEVIPDDGSKEAFEDAVKRWKSMVQKSQILSLYKEKQAYEKPSAKKRRKKREMLERRRVAELREEQIASGEWEKRQKRKEQKRQNRRQKRTMGNKHDE